MKEAEGAFQEALDICRWMANLAPCGSSVAETLNKLAGVYAATQRMKEAEGLDIYRQLAKANPAAQPYVALTLNNLAGFYAASQRMKEAEGTYQEALDAFRRLAKANPGAYQQYVAATLNNLSMLELDANKLTRAQADVEEALSINRQLWHANPEVGKELARSLLIDVAVLRKAQQPRSTLCPLAREGGAVAYNPQLKSAAANKQAEFCSAP